LKNVKVLGVIASIKDEKTHEVIQLAYQPYSLIPQEAFGVKIKLYQVVMLVVFGVLSLFCLGLVVFCLRRKTIGLKKRLDHEVRYQEQQNEFSVVGNESSHFS
jgi:hypothetical protein